MQEILFYRELGFPLDAIGPLLATSDAARLDALRAHRRQLESDLEKSRRLLATLDRTVAHLERGAMPPVSSLFDGFDPIRQAQYEAELLLRFGEPAKAHVAESKRRMGTWSRDDFAAVMAKGDAAHQALATALRAGLAPASAEVQRHVAAHFKWIRCFWTPNRAAYTGLGRLYADHPEFRKFYEAFDVRMPDFMAEAMRLYAERELGDE